MSMLKDEKQAGFIEADRKIIEKLGSPVEVIEVSERGAAVAGGISVGGSCTHSRTQFFRLNRSRSARCIPPISRSATSTTSARVSELLLDLAALAVQCSCPSLLLACMLADRPAAPLTPSPRIAPNPKMQS